MRGLAEELGVAATSIYWHVGGRDKLFDSLVDRLLSEMAHLPVDGDDPGGTHCVPCPFAAQGPDRSATPAGHRPRTRPNADPVPADSADAGRIARRVGRDRNRCRTCPASGAGSRHFVCGDAVLGGSWCQTRGRRSLAVGRRMARSGSGAGAPVPHRLRRRLRIRAQRAAGDPARARLSSRKVRHDPGHVVDGAHAESLRSRWVLSVGRQQQPRAWSQPAGLGVRRVGHERAQCRRLRDSASRAVAIPSRARHQSIGDVVVHRTQRVAVAR